MFSIIHTDGSGDDDPPVETLSELYDELASSDSEHGDVSVIHEDTGWSISAHRDGRIIFGHLGRRGIAKHMIPVPKDKVLELWKRLVDGDIDGLHAEPWKPGYI